MTIFSLLPAGCLLRPAKPADDRFISQFLAGLRREAAPVGSRFQWTVTVVVLAVVAISLLFGDQAILLAFVGFGLMQALLWFVGLLLNLRGKQSDFWIIECCGIPVACAKLCRFPTYSILFDVFVVPKWRGQGLGSYLVSYLAQQAKKPLYLACLPATVPFYTRLGFIAIPRKKLSLVIQHNLGIFSQFDVLPLVLL